MGRLRNAGAVVLVAVAGLGLTAAGAQAGLKNPGFESGDFSHWKTKVTPIEGGPVMRHHRGIGPLPETRWELYTTNTRETRPGITLPEPRGQFSPFINMSGGGHNVLYRTIRVPKKAKMLKLQAYWHNDAGAWSFAGSFIDPDPASDQYFSVDLVKAGSNPETTDPGKVLETLIAPEIPETAPVSDWVGFGTSLKPYRGEKVTLRLAEVDTQSFNYVGIDKLKVTKTK